MPRSIAKAALAQQRDFHEAANAPFSAAFVTADFHYAGFPSNCRQTDILTSKSLIACLQDFREG
jgi:hypothetical protein